MLELDDLSPRMRVVLLMVFAAAAWVAIQSGAIPFGMIGANAQLIAGIAVIGFVGYMALDAVEDADETSEAIRGTGDRVAEATGGILDGVSATILSVVAVFLAAGGSILDLLAQLVDLVAGAPLIGANLAVGGLGILGAVGQLGVTGIAVGTVAIILLGLAIRGGNSGGRWW